MDTKATSTNGIAAPTIGQGEPLVLVVEDDVDTQGYMRALLSARYGVLVAASADEARRTLAEHPEVRIILMDLSLKGDEDGITLTRRLRADTEWKTIPIIATTAHAFNDDRVRALEAGCDAYLAKPIAHRELLKIMAGLLTNGRHNGAPSP